MEGDGTVRRCGGCGCDVVNLSSLDEASARELLSQRTAEVCVSYRHARGKIRFARTRNALAVAAAAAVLLAGAPGRADTSVPPPKPQREKKHKAPKKKPKPRADEDDMGALLKPTF
jgi:hypothetical protein